MQIFKRAPYHVRLHTLGARTPGLAPLAIASARPSGQGFSSDTTQPAEPELISSVNGAPRFPSPWHKWFPYEPIPCSPQLAPYTVQCEQGQDYWWCSCGECRTQPWCEDGGGAHGCKSRGFAPIYYAPRFSGKKWMCGCKKCPGPVFMPMGCYMSWVDQNPVQTSGATFVGMFAFGLITTWLWHP